MRIGVDATCWQNKRGYGRHARSLLNALVRLDQRNHYTFFLDSPDGMDALPPGSECRLVKTGTPTAVAASFDGHRSLKDVWRMSNALSGAEFDVVLFPTAYSYVPVFSPARKVVMIHDIIAESYPELTLPTKRSRLLWKAKLRLARWQADAIATVSDYSRKGIVELYKLDPASVFVVPEASDPQFRPVPRAKPTPRLVKLGVGDKARVVVYVGGFSPHKNLKALEESFATLVGRPEFSDVRLVMVGDYETEVFYSGFAAIRCLVDQLGMRDRVVFTGYLPDEDLVVLLNLATVSVLPSLIEGFGLPAIEAAACGCPVIATESSPLPALLGEGGIFIDPRSRDDLSNALVRVLGSEALRRRMSEAGLAAANRLTWDTAALEMMNLFERLTSS